MANKTIPSNSLKEHIYFVQGMHCASCEILIEKELLTFKGVKSVEAKTDKGQILIEYSGDRPQPGELNKIFQQGNYIFSDHPFEEKTTGENVSMSSVFGIAFLIILGFLALNKLGLAGLVNVNSKSSLITFFGLGIIAGISSCAALVGGLVLSMSKQWSGIYADKKSTFQRIQPHIMFNAGRILCYAILGMLLGFIGSRLQISPKFSSFLIVAVSGMMVFLALQLLGVGYFRKFQFTLPKFITRKVADESNFKGRYMPLLMGALTFFLPCGFTITAQGMALLSGNPIQGSLIMLLFALGTAPSLFLIGLSSIKLVNNPRFSASFLKVAGVLVLFFAFFNINSQLNVLGISSLNDIFVRPASGTQNVDNDTVPVVDGKQIIKMEASASGYKPNYFKVRSASLCAGKLPTQEPAAAQMP